MIDYHIHTNISADCLTDMRNMAEAALRMGLKEICFTEHLDLEFPGDIDFSIDFDKYDRKLNEIKQDYPDLNIRKGIEVGLDMQTKEKLSQLLPGLFLDYVIGSVHIVLGHDPYEKEIWEKYDQQQIYSAYLRVSVECAKACDFYDVFGHLGYISKFCPHSDKLLRYCDYQDAIDTILKILIQKGKGLEVNTNGLYMTPSTMPETPIIRRFFELGGELITIGSDAHYETVVGYSIKETLKTLKKIGFKYVCAFDKRQPRFIPIP
ncbi:MAG: histidinol-phosphatase HisJ family protein [Christensenellales bacterium]|jgi:histidinol-phosphatase (PHP family)